MGVGGRRRRAGGWLSVVAVGMLFVAACSSGSNVVVQAPGGRRSERHRSGAGQRRAHAEGRRLPGPARPHHHRRRLGPAADRGLQPGPRQRDVLGRVDELRHRGVAGQRRSRRRPARATRSPGVPHAATSSTSAWTSGPCPTCRRTACRASPSSCRPSGTSQDGARWFRCDAVVEPLAAERTSIDGTLKDVYAKPLPVSYRLCEARLGQPVACDQDHEIEYLASVLLDSLTPVPDPEGRHPGHRGVPHAAAHRPGADRGADGPGVRLPPADAGGVGRRVQGATCVVGAADGSSLRGTLADIGPGAAADRLARGALPAAAGAPQRRSRGIAERSE